jgi:ATP-dependent RNA helicase RhlE
MSFSDLGLAPALLRALAEKGYDVPTPIQSRAIPAILAGRDVLAGAQTGTGKTAAFVLPILQKLSGGTARAPRALVLTPTRELAAQVADSARTYGKYASPRSQVVFGGVGINPQISALHRGCDLLVATPGRLIDLAEQNKVDLRHVQYLVLDEADRMLDMGFIRPIRRIVKMLPTQRQTLMFSATYSDEIRELASHILRNPESIDVAPRNAAAERVEHRVYRVPKEHKRHLLAHLIVASNWHQVLVFARTKHGANRLAGLLDADGIRTAAIHGNKSQAQRVRALADFKANKVTALVATEVAARGLDIKELPQVVNYELPNVPEDYVHRSVARLAGRSALAARYRKAASQVIARRATSIIRNCSDVGGLRTCAGTGSWKASNVFAPSQAQGAILVERELSLGWPRQRRVNVAPSSQT